MKWGNHRSQIRQDNGKPSVPAWEINLTAYVPEIILVSRPGYWTPDGRYCPTNPGAYCNLTDEATEVGNYSNDSRDQECRAFFEKPGRDGIRITLLVGTVE